MEQTLSYRIELSRFKISNINSNSSETTEGINNAIKWAKDQGYNHILLPNGFYSVKIDANSLVAIKLLSGMHFEMEENCIIRLETNSSPNYSIFDLRGIHQAKLFGGKIIGDKKEHIYEISVKFERGGVNPDGSLNDDSNWIRSEVLNRNQHPGLLANFRLWNIKGITSPDYQYYQYKDAVSKENFAGSRSNIPFAKATSGGNGWLRANEGGVERNNKMIFAIPLKEQLTDQQITDLNAKVDNMYSTHEAGHGITLYGSNNIDISNIEISDCTGDGVFTSWKKYHFDPTLYTQEDMGQHIKIYDCKIHHCRRQGISICGSNDTHIYRNVIHSIGYDDDGVTTNFRNGTAPMFGIDIESMYGETNIPIKTASRPNGFELNYRIHIFDNHIYNNARGHFVNADGTHLVLENNTFEGYNIGGISSNPNFQYVKYINNTFIGCELWVQGDNYVNGAVFRNGNLKMLEVRGAVVQNCTIKDGMLYGSSFYGYIGKPSVTLATSTFSYSTAHGMRNDTPVSFEQWVGKVPNGISVDKLYYTINVTSTSFQLSETIGGTPVILNDVGQTGFHVGRHNYGRCYISNVTIERDWRPNNNLTPNVNLLTTGAVIENVTVKNYDVAFMVPQDYVGRPTAIKGLHLTEGSARFEGCDISNSNFQRAKSVLAGGTDIQLGSDETKYTRQVIMRHCLLQNLGLFLNGNATITSCTFLKSSIGKFDNMKKAYIMQSYFENSNINFHWLRQNQSVTIAKSVFKGVTVAGTAPYVRLVDNTDLGSA
ncbi:right-handed parallel beta-helix repeat-containing protein [Candidatus Pristimantibacillus sp. PTI5]|uniref:right-handed parallel beta-helix repeat-containing protein n=1 Tax=Candidatus Pristimantibacillus sp. PTI5 TaxID=3400422 RepID=UPI003B018E8F